MTYGAQDDVRYGWHGEWTQADADQVFFWKLAFSMARRISGLDMKCCQTKPVRAFSAMTMVIPESMPMTSGLAQLVNGLKASTKP